MIAAVVLTAAWAVYWYAIQKPPVAAGQILEVNYYPVHSTVNGDAGGAGMPGANESYDQLIILTRVRVRNQTNIPLFLNDISATVTMPDGAQQVNVAAGAGDFARVFNAYPALSSHYAEPLKRDITLSPGEQTEGLAVFSFPFSRQQWDSRKNANVVISFIHQNNLSIDFPQ